MSEKRKYKIWEIKLSSIQKDVLFAFDELTKKGKAITERTLREYLRRKDSMTKTLNSLQKRGVIKSKGKLEKIYSLTKMGEKLFLRVKFDF